MPNKKEYTEMTADAKVGLLLGLALIAIIIFAINGVPEFIPSARDNSSVVKTAVTTQTSGALVIEPAVVDVARNLQEKRTSVRYVNPPSEVIPLDESAGGSNEVLAAQKQTTPGEKAPSSEKAKETIQPTSDVAAAKTQVVQPRQQEVAAATTTSQKTVAGANHVVEDGESLAYIAKKYYGEDTGNKKTTIQMLYEANKDILESPDKVQVGDKLVIPNVESATVLLPEPTKKEKDSVVTPQVTPTKKGKEKQAADAQAPAKTQEDKEKEAASQSGSLLDKFKNVFMSTESKKDTPEAKDTTKEKPAVKDATKEKPAVREVTKTKPAAKEITKESAKEKPVIKNVSKDKNSVAANDKNSEKTQFSKGMTTYTVQNGDYLYKIAQKCMGDGDRYPELLKLNSDLLSGSHHLQVGMKLKVPKQ
jgi:nucleoid-associated protein YgaU